MKTISNWKTPVDRIGGRLLYAGQETEVTLNRWKLVLLFVLTFIILAPGLITPLGPDTGLFYVAGQKIAHQGAVHYRDIVDVKPPAIYHLNALSIVLFGDDPFSMRLLDLLLQLLICTLLFRVVRTLTRQDLWAAVAVITYAILYTGSGFSSTMQTESYIGLLLLPAVWSYIRNRSATSFVLVGFLCGALGLLKFTLVAALAAFLVGEFVLMYDGFERAVRNCGLMLSGVAIAIMLFVGYLFMFDAVAGFQNMQAFLSDYALHQYPSLEGRLRHHLIDLPQKMADQYTLTMLFATFAGMIASFRFFRQGRMSTSSTPMLIGQIMTLTFFAMLLSLVVEGKLIFYQMSRLFIPGSILASLGGMRGLQFLGYLRPRIRTWIAVPIVALFLVAFSPLTRYVFHMRPVYGMVRAGLGSFSDYYSHRLPKDHWSMSEVRDVGDFIKSDMGPDDKMFVSSGVAGLVYLAIDYVPDVSVFHSGFLIAEYAPAVWRDSIRSWLLAQRPKYVVLQTNDRMPVITHSRQTSVELFQTFDDVWRMLTDEYALARETQSFKVFVRTSASQTDP